MSLSAVVPLNLSSFDGIPVNILVAQDIVWYAVVTFSMIIYVLCPYI